MVRQLSGADRLHNAHISALRGDAINPPLLGMEKAVSEDAVRRGLRKIDDPDGVAWMQTHLDAVTAPLLSEPWILDTYVAVKPLYGHQEGAVVGDNPHRPGRPSHSYHTYFITICAWCWMPKCNPAIGRHPRTVHRGYGNCWSDWGTQGQMARAEQEGLPYPFTLRLIKRAKQPIEHLLRMATWTDAGRGW